MIRDSLTGVYNRRFLLEALDKEVARCSRYGEPIGLLFVDVDGFKPLNDTWGHLVGDEVLRQVAEVLGETLRAADILARFGGEEFVILPNHPFNTGLVQLAERLRQAVEDMRVQTDSGPVSVTVSVGCTLAVPLRNETHLARQLLAAADAAMYEAKQLGRNRIVFRSMLKESERQLIERTLDGSFSHWLVDRKILTADVLEQVLSDDSPKRLPLGELAKTIGLLTEEQIAEILQNQHSQTDRFGDLAQKKGFLTAEQVAILLAHQRENPLGLARLLIEKNLLPESEAWELVQDYLGTTQSLTDNAHPARWADRS